MSKPTKRNVELFIVAYFGIDVEEVWNIITLRLDILAEDLAVIVKKHPVDITEALACTIKEYQAQENFPIVKYLTHLQKTLNLQ